MFEYDDYNYDYQQRNTWESDPEPGVLLEFVTRYGSYFCSAITTTFIVRSFPGLMALYWIVAIVGLLGLALAIHLTRKVQLLAFAAVVVAALLAGHMDGMQHHATQMIQSVEGAIQR